MKFYNGDAKSSVNGNQHKPKRGIVTQGQLLGSFTSVFRLILFKGVVVKRFNQEVLKFLLVTTQLSIW